MGCDIHLHVEIKINGKWEHYQHPKVRRNYNLFALMADVRNSDGDVIPVSRPKGIPDDISFMTKFCLEQDKGKNPHSHSWLSAAEIAQLEHEWKQVSGEMDHEDLEQDLIGAYFFGNSYAGFHLYRRENPRAVEDLRFVFWFDC
jgi:hypothetical protein